MSARVKKSTAPKRENLDALLAAVAPDALAQTLVDRRAIHGDFTDHARITQAMKDVAHASPSWAIMTPVQRESIDMMLHKIGRVCAGNPSHGDHWHDIQGYARLAEERLS